MDRRLNRRINYDYAMRLRDLWPHEWDGNMHFHWIYVDGSPEAFDSLVDRCEAHMVKAPTYMEIIDYIVANRWFVDLSTVNMISDDTVWEEKISAMLFEILKNMTI